MSNRKQRRSFRESLFGTGVYDASLPSNPAVPLGSVPICFPGDARTGRSLRTGDLIRTLKSVSKSAPTHLEAPNNSVHNFSWLPDLAASGLETAATVARELTALWISEHGRWHAHTWQYDVLAERLSTWLTYLGFLLDDADADFNDLLLRSLHRQAGHLRRLRRLGAEPPDGFGVGRTEVFRELIFERSSAGLLRSLGHLKSRMELEILPDGGHRSRNPAAHLNALRALCEIRTAVAHAGHGIPVWLQTALDKMAPLLRTFRHPDGGICQFNGAAMRDKSEIDAALDLADAGGRAIVNASHSGFQRLSAGRTVVIMDSGIPDPAGEAEHAGTLSFEMTHDKRRIVVNCGIPPNASGQLREICRGSAAHSTVVIENRNSSEIHGSTGMGARRAARLESYRQESDGNVLVEASHSGYRGSFGLVHRRALYMSADGTDLRGEDTISGPGPFGGVVRFHLHPDVDAVLVEDGSYVLLRSGKMQGWRFLSSVKSVQLEDSVYFGGGLRRQCRQIVVSFTHRQPETVVKWRFRREKQGAWGVSGDF